MRGLWHWLIDNGNGQDAWTDFVLINFWTILAIVVSHRKARKQRDKQHEETMRAHRRTQENLGVTAE
jgi:hypothetical protein